MSPPAFVFRMLLVLATALIFSGGGNAKADSDRPRVVTSLKPLELLVRAVAQDQVEVTTLLPPGSSPHTYQLRPSERRQLAAAELVFWVGPGMENFLTRLLTGPDLQARSVALAPRLQGAGHSSHEGAEGHDDEHTTRDERGNLASNGHGHAEGENPHIWLDPVLALRMAQEMADHLKALEGVDPTVIDDQLSQFNDELTTKEASIRQQLVPVRQVDLFTYHEAFGRFSEHYDLKVAGELTLSPERNPGARHLAELQAQLGQAEQPCLMTEPQFNRQWWESLMGDVEVPVRTWDPLATNIEPTPHGYVEFQQSLADAVLDCLPEHAQQ